jgi:lysophospholipase L1-like esterase
MTITAGANDIYWQYFVRQCFNGSCGSVTDDAVTTGLRVVLRMKLEFAMANISSRSNGSPPVVILTGYYQPFSAACARQQTRITSNEIAWLNRQTQAINSTISSVANHHAFARYVPVSFSGHELCSNDSWVQGASDPAPFHPTAEGQRVIASAVLSQLR